MAINLQELIADIREDVAGDIFEAWGLLQVPMAVFSFIAGGYVGMEHGAVAAGMGIAFALQLALSAVPAVAIFKKVVAVRVREAREMLDL